MLKPFLFVFKNLRVKSIPHGGLGTLYIDGRGDHLRIVSPSHAVGLEQKPFKGGV
jgi:hypothetical protein